MSPSCESSLTCNELGLGDLQTAFHASTVGDTAFLSMVQLEVEAGAR